MIGAEIGHHIVSQPEDCAVVFTCYLDCADLAAPMDRGGEILSPRLDPFYWPRKFQRDEAEDGLFAVDVQLAAESAAHFWSDHANTIFRQLEHHCDLRAKQVGYLRR